MRVLLTFALTALLGLPASAATLIHEYNFNSGSVTDSVGSLDGALYGGASIVGGQLILDGQDDYAELNGYAVPTSGDYSVALRARQDSVQSGDYVEMISQGFSQAGNPPGGFYIGHDPSRQMRFGDQFRNSTGVTMPADGLFHDYVLTSSVSAGTNVYIDGVLVFSATEYLANNVGGTHTRFGDQFQSFTEFFHGALDDILIYQGAMSLSEVQAYSTDTPAVPLPLPAVMLLSGLGLLVFARRNV